MKALVLLSGGQDSTTCLAQACADFPNEVTTLAFNYGQRHTIELEQAKKIAALANVPFDIIDLSYIATLSQNALTSHTIPIESSSETLPNTFVPGRNIFFLSTAAVIAKEKEISILYTGVCETDYSGYPDCRHDFIKSLETTVSLGLNYPITIKTPLMNLTKAETVLLMKSLGKLDWYKESHTCYEGKRPACGTCPACLLRLQGFKKANIIDPIKYIKN